MEALLPKATVGTTSMGFASVQPFEKSYLFSWAVDADGHESKYYRVNKNIIEYSFAGCWE
jgi:hypothetical protein